MKSYKIKIFDAKPADYSEVGTAEIDCFRWFEGYTPRSYAKLFFVKNDGFYVRMYSEETDPRAECRNFFDAVCEDSCLEFFAAFDGTKDDYVNVEMNCKAVSHIAFGKDRHSRQRIDSIVGKPFDVVSGREGSFWFAEARITLADLEKIYGLDPTTFTAGYRFRGNFYKCGDKTEMLHYGMWSPVDNPTPDYHRPEFFGEFIME
ncbi:MAG: carbohydrate-binding family 9-like protein [Firmicutes bacterium]|nr:carbohydrate-binding family 9-like protein [Candidatus Colimorpha enterica]